MLRGEAGGEAREEPSALRSVEDSEEGNAALAAKGIGMVSRALCMLLVTGTCLNSASRLSMYLSVFLLACLTTQHLATLVSNYLPMYPSIICRFIHLHQLIPAPIYTALCMLVRLFVNKSVYRYTCPSILP